MVAAGSNTEAESQFKSSVYHTLSSSYRGYRGAVYLPESMAQCYFGGVKQRLLPKLGSRGAMIAMEEVRKSLIVSGSENGGTPVQ